MQGKIIKAISGFYYVHDGKDVYSCRARGVFRNRDTKPLVGDDVGFEVTNAERLEGQVTEVFERSNELSRPAVANVDRMLAFFALKDPAPSILHISRLLLSAEIAGIEAVLIFNKADLSTEEEAAHMRDVFRSTGYEVRTISVKDGEGIEEIKPLLKGRTTVLAGPSGVGKSSFLNAIMDEEKMETGVISEKLQRGKHTTRHTELFSLGDDSYLLDTPGFSALDNELDPEDVGNFFPEFRDHIDYCRFVGCVHVNEPDCGVKQALADGIISEERYEAYMALYLERKNARKY